MTRVSTFGEYQGYSDERYDRVTRSSVYAPLRDGVEVAADIYRPGTAQGPASERLPVVLMVTRYWRAKQLEDGVIASPLGLLPAGETQIALNTADIRFHEPVRPLTLHRLAAHGYVVVVMENRGTGSSFGVMGQPSQQDSEGPLTDGMMNGIQYDLHDMVEWCAQQPFGNGRVAMAGGSWLGWMQLAAAVGRPPSLQATFPRVPSALHGHRIFHFGGLFFKGAMVTMGRTLIQLAKGEQDQMALGGVRIVGPPPVDDDPDGIRMKEARAAHGDASFEAYFRSTLTSPTGQELFADLGIDDPAEQLEIMFDQARLDTALRGRPDLRRALQDSPMFDDERAAQVAADLLADISDSGVPAYLWDGWRDPHPHDRLMMYANLTSPRRLAMGPWAHGPLDPFDQREKEAENILAVESLRWYDRWVKDVPNGIDEEPSLAWCTEAAGPRWRWHHSDAWPLADAQRVVHRLGGGPSGTLDAGNDGVLSSDEVEPGRDSFTVDYAATTGTQTTYHSATGGGAIDLPDMRVNDTRGLAYTSEPLTEEVTVAGTPIFHLFVTADAPDTTFVVHVEEVLPNGRSELIKQGFLRASHRSLRELPYDNLGAPFFSSLPQDVGATAPLDDGVAELVIGTEPMARTFSVGNRIRVTITGADEGVVWSVPDERPPTITLLRDADHPSHVSLPIWRPPS